MSSGRSSPGRLSAHEWAHLIRRFFDVAQSRRLSPSEQSAVATWVDSVAESSAFWDQPVADQRHALRSAQFVADRRPEDREAVRAALFHDLGKRHARLGIVGRSVAGVCRALGLPARGRLRGYLEHGPIGARELERFGASNLVVDFARHHHDGRRPAGIPQETWALLQLADDETA